MLSEELKIRLKRISGEALSMPNTHATERVAGAILTALMEIIELLESREPEIAP